MIFLSFFLYSCGDKKNNSENAQNGIVKYAKFRANVYKDKDLTDKQYLTTLERMEEVELLSFETYKPENPKYNKPLNIAYIKLTDGKTGYTLLSYLADKIVVFYEDIACYERPTVLSKAYYTIPRGTIGFVVETNDEGWIKIYIGKINGKYISDKWVEKSYTDNFNTIVHAKDYETVITLLESGKEESRKKALDILNELSENNDVIALMAKEKIAELKQMQEDQVDQEEYDGEDATEESGSTDDKNSN